MKISYNWLKWYIPEVVEAEKLADVFTYHLCEVESVEKLGDDTIFDLNILPNRAHDLLSHHGIARELAGQLGIKFNDPSGMYKVPESKPTNLKIEIQTDKCRRYMGRIVRNIKVSPSPEWVVKHLESIGQRSINNIVDATNLCMYDCGQPMHAFDLKKLFSEKIVIRQANKEEKITTLDDKHVELNESEIVISSEAETLAIAGVKGGISAEVDENTTEIVLEVANFEPATVRKTARRLGILTDSAKRFENDLSPELASFGMKELTGLIIEMCPEATFEDVVDVYPSPQEKREIVFSVDQITKKLGADISAEKVEDILKRYNFEYKNEGGFTIIVPSLRLDLVGTHDMAEEIGRIIGYDKVVPMIPKIAFEPKMNDTQTRMNAAREKLLADGYSEVITYAFCKKGKIEVAYGAKGKEFLRTNLSDGLKESYELNRLNAPFLGIGETKIFEIGTVFPEVGVEEIHVAYANKKGVVESTLEAFFRDLSPENASSNQTSNTKHQTPFIPWSHYPFISRDVAVWVPVNTEVTELINLCKKNGTNLLVREPYLFDQFTKGGKTSLGVRLVFQSHERTLKDEEVTEIMTTIGQEIGKKGWEVR
ncbi:MAG: phenylalanine--tRNA ligase subunit beta [Candidatus Pacebacteria bacterium]|nr:phenylalanine--tRNA ligase subunit beta [Candidatus Paceibacterota bacterium]